MQEYITDKFADELEKNILICANEKNPLEELGKAYFNFFYDNPNYFHFLFNQANISLDLTKDGNAEKKLQALRNV